MKLCRECRWFKQDTYRAGYCLHRKAASPTSVWQETTGYMRGMAGDCGKDGKLWEPRQSFWQRMRATFSSDAGR